VRLLGEDFISLEKFIDIYKPLEESNIIEKNINQKANLNTKNQNYSNSITETNFKNTKNSIDLKPKSISPSKTKARKK